MESLKLIMNPYLAKSGNLKIEVLAIDNVNNKIRTEMLSSGNKVSYVDLTGPKLGHNFTGPSFVSKDTFFISRDTEIKLSGNDDESGFKELKYRIDPAAQTKKY